MSLWLGLSRFSYWIASGLYPTGFHVVNIVLHGVVSVTFLFFVSFILGDGQSFSSDGRFLFPHPRTSLLAAVLFAVHPIHTESVSGEIVGYCLMISLLLTDMTDPVFDYIDTLIDYCNINWCYC